MKSSYSQIWTITAGATLLQGANGLLQIVLPLRMEAEGLTIGAIGLVAASYGFGFAAGCFVAPAFVRHIGHIRAFASLAALAAVVTLGFTQAGELWTWILLRAISGVTLAGLFTVIDGWVSARATSANRGRVISLYMICTKIALMLSPLGIGLGSVEADGLFMAMAAMLCLSLMPVSATICDEPRPPSSARLMPRRLLVLAPSAVVGAFIVGLVNGSVIAMTPIFGVRSGLSPEQAAWLVLALQCGSLLLQWPLGWLSDIVDRRKVIAGLSAATALVSGFILWAAAQGGVPLLVLAFGLWGGVALCIYAVCVAHACDLVAPEEIIPAIGTLLMCWALGAAVGPVPSAALMAWAGAGGLFVFAGAISLAFALFVVVRIGWKKREPSGSGFVNILATSPAAAELATGPERVRDGDSA